MPKAHQERLGGFEASPHANFHIVRKPLLSASTLASWLVCRTKPFIQRILERVGVDVTNAAMRRGAEAHAEVQGALAAVAPTTDLTFPQAIGTKQFLFANEVHLLDERRRLHGFVDILFTRNGDVHILELKNSRPPRVPDPTWGALVWPEHAMQVHLYGILGRSEFGVTPRLSLSYLRDGSKEKVLDELTETSDPEQALLRLEEASVHVPHGDAERTRVLHEVQAFQRAEKGLEVPLRDHDDVRRCGNCSVRAWCPRRLDMPGRFLELDARLLADGD